MTRRELLVVLAVINGVLAVFIAAGLVLLVVVPALDRPTAAAAPPVRPVVEAYLDAVADGDVAGALAVTRIQTGTFDGASSGLLHEAVLRGAQERIADPRVGAVELSGSGSRAEITVACTLGGESHEAVLRREYDEDAQAWWVVAGLLGTLRVAGLSGHGIPVEVAGVTPDPRFLRVRRGRHRCGHGGARTRVPYAAGPLAPRRPARLPSTRSEAHVAQRSPA